MEREDVERIIDEKVSFYKKIIAAFLSGFLIFVSMGIVFPERILLPILESIYSPEYIFDKNKKLIVSDPSLMSDLFNDTRKKTVLDKLKDHKISGVKLENFPTLSKEIPNEVWKTIEDGDKKKYDSIMNEKFTEALKDKFYKEMQLAFATDNPLRNEELVKQIEKLGELELKANLVTVSSRHQGKSTNCNINFDHELLSAIIVLPEKIDHGTYYRWLDCPSYSFPYTELTIRRKNGPTVSEVKVVGVEKTGKAGVIELRLSRKTAEELEMSYANKYLSSGIGKFHLSDATFDW